jgi:hypothetical protein
MYVYFDKKGDIKAIAPDEDISLNANYKYTMAPISEVEDFLTTKKNTYNYVVKEHKRVNGKYYKIEKKETASINYAKTLDSYLTMISDSRKSIKNSIITITNNISRKEIVIDLNFIFSELDDDEKEKFLDTFPHGSGTFYLTKKYNPYYLYKSFGFSIQDLIQQGSIIVECEDSYRNASVYTKRVIEGYGYIEKE